MRWPAVFAVVALAVCGEGHASGPLDGLPLDGNFRVAVDAPVHVTRDRHGIAHPRRARSVTPRSSRAT